MSTLTTTQPVSRSLTAVVRRQQPVRQPASTRPSFFKVLLRALAAFAV